ncbi:hypothetical protein Tco_0848085 [Tanacetum coccineum]
MTEYVSDKGDGMTAMYRIRNVDKGVISVVVANKKAYAAFKRDQDKYVTSWRRWLVVVLVSGGGDDGGWWIGLMAKAVLGNGGGLVVGRVGGGDGGSDGRDGSGSGNFGDRIYHPHPRL